MNEYTPRHKRETPSPLAARLSELDPARLAEYRDNVAAAEVAVLYTPYLEPVRS